MSVRIPDESSHNIVMVGDFNALIYKPAWFASVGLIRESEAKQASIDIMHRDIVSFSLDWLTFQATPGKLTLNTTQESCFEVLRDLALGLTQTLKYTPIRQLGLNYRSHTSMPKDWKWEMFQGVTLQDSFFESVDNTKLRSITFEVNRDYNNYKGYHNFTVESSKSLKGIYIGSNDHYELPVEEVMTSEPASKIIEEQWGSTKKVVDDFRTKMVEKYE